MRSQRASVAVVAFLIFTSIFATNIPSPLYVIYQAKFHFSSLTITGIYAIYAVGIVVALVCVGQLSDQVGRRPVLLVALALVALGALLFVFAESTALLFVARAVQGLATGTLASAATAAMADLAAPGERQRASLVTTLAYTCGGGFGNLVAGLMAQYLPDPLVLPFIVVLVLTGCAVVGVLVIPEPSSERPVEEWRLQRPSVPRSIRAPFVAAGLALAVSWSIGGVYGALCPSMTSELLHIESHAFAGVMLFCLNAIGGAAQLILRRHSPRTLVASGAASIAAGVGLIDLSVVAHSAALFLLATILAGSGSSLAFVGGLSRVNVAAPAARRAEVLAALNLVGYVGLTLPVLGLGLLSVPLGLADATGVFAAAIAGLSFVTLALASRPAFESARDTLDKAGSPGRGLEPPAVSSA